jgi:hypothetical protein
MGGVKLVLPLALLAAAATATAAGIDVYDGFETSALGKLWTSAKFVPGALEIQSAIVRAGKAAAKITIHEGDLHEVGRSGVSLERAELLEARELWAIDDRTYVYSFAIWLPREFPIVPTRLVIAQWKQRCELDACDPDNPVVALRYIGGELLITHQSGSRSVALYRTAEEVRGRWLNFRFELRFSRTPGGRIKSWLNDRQVVDYQGATAYPETGGYPSRNRFYFKMGLYRDRMAEPMTIFIDEYRKVELAEGSPAGK